jgi:hypothetical protein
MNVRTFIIIAATVLAVLLLCVYMTHRRRLRQANQAAELLAERRAVLLDLIQRIESGDSNARQMIGELIDPYNYYSTWLNFGRKTNLGARMDAVIAKYDHDAMYNEIAGQLEDSVAASRDESQEIDDRIRAAYTVWRTLEGYSSSHWKVRNEVIEDLIGGRDDAKTLLDELVDARANEFDSEASAGDKEAFWRLYYMRFEANNGYYHLPDKHQRYFFQKSGGPEWTDTENWLALVGRYIASPTLDDFGVHLNRDPHLFAQEVVEILRAGTRLRAKIARARLLEDTGLYSRTPEQLKTAIYTFAATGERPQLDLLLATKPASDQL